jgi:hypothetical protein
MSKWARIEAFVAVVLVAFWALPGTVIISLVLTGRIPTIRELMVTLIFSAFPGCIVFHYFAFPRLRIKLRKAALAMRTKDVPHA